MTRQTKKTAFTLIEMMATIAILLLFVALLVPAFVRQVAMQQERDFFPQLQSLVAQASSQAVSTGKIVILSYDSSQNQFQLIYDTTTDPNAPTDTNITQSSDQLSSTMNTPSNPASTINPAASGQNSTDQSQPFKTLAMPSAITTTDFQVRGQDTASGDWQVRFYPDGASDPSAIQFQTGNTNQTFSISNLAATKLVDGDISQVQPSSWSAGSIEQRQSQ